MTTVGGDDEEVVARRRAALRDRGRAARAALTAPERAAAGALVVDRLARLPEVRDARRVLLTRAIGDELDLVALEGRLRAAGTIVALPVVGEDGLRVVDVDPDTPMRAGWRGIPEPVGPDADEPPDVVVVPALVVDRRGERLGWGGGHFDRLLAGRARRAVRVGAVFATQVVDRLPRLPHDVPLDVVVTEQGVSRVGRPGR